MEPVHFDRATRRAVLAISGTGIAALFGLDATDAKRRKKKKKKKKVEVCLRGQTLTVPLSKRDDFLLAGATLGKCPVAPVDICEDGVRNGDEVDVDCGGSCGRCADGKACNTFRDCRSSICKTNASSATGKACGVCTARDASCGTGCECAEAMPNRHDPELVAGLVCVRTDVGLGGSCSVTCNTDRVCAERFVPEVNAVVTGCWQRCGTEL